MKKIFKQKYLVITALVIFLIPIIGVPFRNIFTCLQFFNHLHSFFGLDSLKDFFTFWITLFGAIGLAINIYYTQIRIQLQDKQLAKQDKQLQLQQEHTNVLSKTQQDNRFAKGVELLGNASESARTGAAYNLFFLAKEFPEEYSKPVFEILCSHIRTKTNEEEYQSKYKCSCSNEIQTTVDLLFKNHGDEQYPFANYQAHLNNCFLAGCNLGFAYLKKAYLMDTYLEKAHLTSAYLEGARLGRAYLVGADLENAHLAEVYLMGAHLEHVNLEHANLKKANLWNTHLERANLWNSHLEKAYLVDAHLEGANLERAHLEGADLEGAHLREANLEGVDLSEVVNLDKALNLDEALNVDRDSFPEYMKSK